LRAVIGVTNIPLALTNVSAFGVTADMTERASNRESILLVVVAKMVLQHIRGVERTSQIHADTIGEI
jgi:hypothetical protein